MLGYFLGVIMPATHGIQCFHFSSYSKKDNINGVFIFDGSGLKVKAIIENVEEILEDE